MLRSLSMLAAGAAAVLAAAPGHARASGWDHHFFHWDQSHRHRHLHEDLAHRHAREHFFHPGMHPWEHWRLHRGLEHQHRHWHHRAELDHFLHHHHLHHHHVQEWPSADLYLWWNVGPGIVIEVR